MALGSWADGTIGPLFELVACWRAQLAVSGYINEQKEDPLGSLVNCTEPSHLRTERAKVVFGSLTFILSSVTLNISILIRKTKYILIIKLTSLFTRRN
jgi:hypothetical protein